MGKNSKDLRSAKRFGTRYGRSLKLKVADIEASARSEHKCPYCNYIKVKRVNTGIWACGNCNAKFTGKAYTLAKVKGPGRDEEAEMELMVEEDPKPKEEEDYEDDEEDLGKLPESKPQEENSEPEYTQEEYTENFKKAEEEE